MLGPEVDPKPKCFFFSKSSLDGLVLEARWSANSDTWLTIPLGTSTTFLGVAKFLMASIFSGSAAMPSDDTMWPKTFTLLTLNSHFTLLIVIWILLICSKPDLTYCHAVLDLYRGPARRQSVLQLHLYRPTGLS